MQQSNKRALWRKIVDKSGLSIPFVLMMAKYAHHDMKIVHTTALMRRNPADQTFLRGAIAPTIGLAIYQNDTVADHFSTIGYLIPIMSVLVVPVMPRARFLQNLVVTSLLVCLAAAISLLAMWCAVRARANTTHIPPMPTGSGPVPGARVSTYNAAASVNMAVWLFFEVWLANTFRAYRPQYFLPSIVFSVFINVTATYGTLFATMAEAESLVNRLLQTFFCGFGISAAVGVFVLPFSSRTLVSMRITEAFHDYKAVLEAQSQFMQSISSRDLFGAAGGSRSLNGDGSGKGSSDSEHGPWVEAEALKKATIGVAELQVQIHSELRFAKREISWGKLGAKDFGKVSRLLRDILIPVSGMESLVDVAELIEKDHGWDTAQSSESNPKLTAFDSVASARSEKEQWDWIFQQLQGPTQRLLRVMIEGLDHALYTLEFAKRPRSASIGDIEAKSLHRPGDKGFTDRLECAIQEFLQQREGPLKEWCSSKGMDSLPPRHNPRASSCNLHELHQSQLYLLLSMGYQFLSTAQGILCLARWADSKVEDGTMGKKRLILPSWKRMVKWMWAAISREDNNLDYEAASTRCGTVTVYLGDALHSEKDAEHLPPRSTWEKASNRLLVIPEFLGSAESYFGFRVATGTMVIAIVCYLRNSQNFFITQRLIWGSIMVAISMTQTAGSGIYGQFMRFGGTALAMVASYIDWYIVDQHTAGIIVFAGITMFLYHYLLVKSPDNPVVPMIGMVTVILIVGYALQVQKIGIALSERNGQAYHPLYELAPYRLAAVGAGVAVACFFTYFPSVITARSQLRRDLGSGVYLLAHYYSSVHTTVSLRIRGTEGDLHDKKSPARMLDKARARIFAKELILLQGMKQHCAFTAWEPSFGGRFPRESYDKLINHTQSILHFTAMISFVTESLRTLPIHGREATSSSPWLTDFRQLIAALQLTSQSVTSLLSIVSSAISTGKPLPPYLQAPPALQLSQRLQGLDQDILSTRHVCEPGYAAFAVMQVATTMLAHDLEGLLSETKKLVGEMDFNVNVVREEDWEADVDPVGAVEERD